MMWNGKNKAVTFSFDDGVTQDRRLIEILNRYDLKATFNVNSSLFGLPGEVRLFGKTAAHTKNQAKDVAKIYFGHEIAVHTLTHPNLTELDEETIVWQVEKDREVLGGLVGYEVCGMAYPCGGVNNDDRVAAIVKSRTGVRYVRTITSTYNFDLQENLYRFHPSVHFIEWEKMFELAEKFLQTEENRPQLFYIWGHSYEMDLELIGWEKFEEFCKLISHREDIFYGTNFQCLLQ